MVKDEIKEDVLRFLKEKSTAVVATSWKNIPKVSTVYYFVDNEFNFYFATKRKTSKYLNAELNPFAAFVVGTGPETISVQANGRVDLIVNEAEREKILDLLIGKQKLMGIKIWPIDELKNFKDSYKVVYKISPTELYYMNINSEKHKETESDEIIKVI